MAVEYAARGGGGTTVTAALTARGTHAFLFDGAASPFGTGAQPADTRALPAAVAGTGPDGGTVKAVVTAVGRDDGIGGTHRTTYGYQGRGRESTRNWGFLGFYATRETDAATAVSTYTQYRLDFPHFGRPAAVFQYRGRHGAAGAEVLSKRYTAWSEMDVDYRSSSPAVQATTHLAYASATTELVHEGGTVAAARDGRGDQRGRGAGSRRAIRNC